jgi:hypothetical protein
VPATDQSAWEAYGLAFAGAAAVLLGLIFVGLSINLERLLRVPWLIRRAGAAVVELMAVFVASAFVLVPGQSGLVLGLELVATGLVGSALLAWLLLRDRESIDAAYRRRSEGAATMGILGLSFFVLAGLSLVMDVGGGLYWLVPATLLCVARAMLESWVLLVEVNR